MLFTRTYAIYKKVFQAGKSSMSFYKAEEINRWISPLKKKQLTNYDLTFTMLWEYFEINSTLYCN